MGIICQAGLATLEIHNVPCMIPQMHTQAMQALKHPWLRNIGSDKDPVSALISRTEVVDESIIKLHTYSSTDHPTSMLHSPASWSSCIDMTERRSVRVQISD